MAYERFETLKQWARAYGCRGARETLNELWREHGELLALLEYCDKEDMEFIKNERDRLSTEVKKLREAFEDVAAGLASASKQLDVNSRLLTSAVTDSVNAEHEATRKRGEPKVELRPFTWFSPSAKLWR